ncbi:hypothetical protein CDD81_4200 [Ophiocordyceps australis]|uniref:F-box domain-containing protein n=1 Tax=Ophiocordyceps australis TaxID=1399860 RepID=A0A2C5XAG9_9HYPO|nr:hypothetical protein CDD81_4200 [Ophiocordyceps australis]
MQQEPTETPKRLQSSTQPKVSSFYQNGSADSSDAAGWQCLASNAGVSVSDTPEVTQVNRVAAGQRIIDYENAICGASPNTVPDLKATKNHGSSAGSTKLADLPNEILTDIISFTHPDSYGSLALVSKRFHFLVNTSHAWHMAFLRYFPAQTVVPDLAQDSASEVRYFGRLTLEATWRSEYLLRTRLMKSLGRGRPGRYKSTGIRSSPLQKKNAVLTYNSRLPWRISNLHAIYSHGRLPLRAMHGVADLGVANMSDPHNAKVENWDNGDEFVDIELAQLAASGANYGLSDGPTSTPSTMDVSQPFGFVLGQGSPGSGAYFRPADKMRGRLLASDNVPVGAYPDMPKIPRDKEAICSVWISKSVTPLTTAQSMCGIMTGSTLGVVTAYHLGSESEGLGYDNGDMTARWALSPGVPIISIKLDDSYSAKRSSASRLLAVALNALGEVFYLTQPLLLPCPSGIDTTARAWKTGRSVCWRLIDSTRRSTSHIVPRLDAELEVPWPLDPLKLVAHARETERLMELGSAYFRSAYSGWDMRRRLEVDFAADDDKGAGEVILVMDCGVSNGQRPAVRRYTRAVAATQPHSSKSGASPLMPKTRMASLFAPIEAQAGGNCAPEQSSQLPRNLDNWRCSSLQLMSHDDCTISACALECSCYSLLTMAEDPLCAAASGTATATPSSCTETERRDSAIPGHRARFIAVGTNSGVILVWNCRDGNSHVIHPVRIIQTESSSISCLAVSALYLVHGGSDGLVQIWDHLASSEEAVRTINSKSDNRVPRHVAMNPALRNVNFSSVDTMSLDPDPTVMRGVLTFGTLLRYWNYGPATPSASHKRRHRSSLFHGHGENRRLGRAVSGYIAAEQAEMRRENERQARDKARLRQRFGVGLSVDLTEEETLLYAEMMSQESFLIESQRRASDCATRAASDEALSRISGSMEMATTPEPSDANPSHWRHLQSNDENEFEQQVQQAIRLSLLEAANQANHLNQPRQPSSSGLAELESLDTSSDPSYSATGSHASPAGSLGHWSLDDGLDYRTPLGAAPQDDDLALALRLSLQDEQQHDLSAQQLSANDFPPLQSAKHKDGHLSRR